MPRILIVDDEPTMCKTIARFLHIEGYDVLTAANVEQANEVLSTHSVDVVISDILMPGASGVDLLKNLRDNFPDLKVILITGEPTVDTAIEAVRKGAFDYLSKPIEKDLITKTVKTAIQVQTLEKENRNYQSKLEQQVQERTKKILEYSNRLKNIAENIRQFSAYNDKEDLFNRILSLAAHNVGAEGGNLYIKQDGALELVCSLDKDHANVRVELPPTEGSVMARLYTERVPFLVDDISDEEHLQSSGWSGYSNGSLLMLPLIDAKSEIQGVLTLHNKIEPPFSDQDLQLGEIIASHGMEALKSVELSLSLQGSEKKYRELAECSKVGILVHQDGELVYANAQMVELLGYRRGNLEGRKFLDLVHPQDLDRVRQYNSEFLEDGGSPDRYEQYEFRMMTKEGESRHVDASISMIEHLGRNAVMVNMNDITDRTRAEEEKRELEMQLQQVQKLDSIGRLAGGVAHDFNNLLTGITGNVSLAMMDMKSDNPLAGTLKEINKIAGRAANLTRQLLAFSSRQIIEPVVVDLNSLVNDLNKMLIRIIGEDIKLQIKGEEQIGRIKVDPGQIEQIIVNLAVNARDAMPRGGQLTLSTANVEIDEGYCESHPEISPGSYVMMTISDTGCGMDSMTLSRIFEPFFTTKSKGKGTGLGLSTVYGIVKQHNGSLDVYSDFGYGTSFKICFPRVDMNVVKTMEKESESKLPNGEETILFVEDDPIVRNMTIRALKRLGYQVMHAASGEEGENLANKMLPKLDLLITDVIMPGISGKELVQRLSLVAPDLKSLFTSGYTSDTVLQQGMLKAGGNFLSKPYSPQRLAYKVREILDI